MAQITVNQFPFLEQLPSNSVPRVFQDKEGYIWLGTMDGLCRYDGYRILSFRSDMNNPNRLTNNEITCIAEDNNNYLWIGTKRGVNILDKRSYHISFLKDEAVQNQEIRYILVASDSTIWVAAGVEIYCYRPDFSLKCHYNSRFFNTDNLAGASINSIYEDRQGSIWVLIWRGGLFRFDAANDRFIPFPAIGSQNNPFRLFQDNRQRYWICTWRDGLFLFDPEKDTSSPYTYIAIKNESRNLPESIFYSIVQDDSDAYIWVMSFSGLFAFRYNDDGSLEKADIAGLFKETNNLFSEIIKDRDGNLWIGAFSEGAITVTFNKPGIQNYSLEPIREKKGVYPSVTAIYEDNEGIIWATLNRDELCFINPEDNTIRMSAEFPEVRKIWGDFGLVTAIGKPFDTEDVWIAKETPPSLISLRKTPIGFAVSNKIYQMLEKLPEHEKVHYFVNDNNKNTWIATEGGVVVKPFQQDNCYPVNNKIRNITDMTKDSVGNIWISCENAGVYKISVAKDNLANSPFTNYSKATGDLKMNNIQAVCGDKNGRVWLGAKEGNLLVYEPQTGEFQDVSTSCAMTGEAILNILMDDYQHIWISTNKKITEYNPINQASTYYTLSDGLVVNSFAKNACCKGASGKIYFGGSRGICSFSPSERLSKPSPSNSPFITNINIQNASVFNEKENATFDRLVNRLVLNPEEKNIEIEFSTLNYVFPSKIQYAYKMDGIDKDWVYAGNSRQFATYSSLKKGHYLFHIIATDDNGLWNENETLLTIYKKPAFYETWWAYMAYSALVLLAVLWGLWFYANRLKLRNELKIAQIDKRKSEELTQTKLRYFTNISHDLLTPLTIISCLIDDIESRSKGKFSQHEIMRSNINRLKYLLQQVLDFRKAESGNMKLKITRGEIVSFIRNICYTNFSPLIEKKKINFKFIAYPEAIPAWFDSDKIDKIIFNLLSNAFKYTNSGGDIRVELQAKEADNHTQLQIEVSDTGKGISEKDLPHIFIRFFNNDAVQMEETNGIGLSLTKDLVELHHGTISVESLLHHGTVFRIEIPIDKERFGENELSEAPFADYREGTGDYSALNPVEWADEEQEKKNIHLLIVEDNEDLRILIASIFSKRYFVITAENGEKALSLIKEHKIDMIISDVMMPEMDGLELCRRIKNDLETSHIFVLLLTVKHSAEDRVECYNAGADGYISKPFDLKVLKARVDNLVRSKRKRQNEFKSNVEINISALEYPSLDEDFLKEAVLTIEKHLSKTGFDVNVLAKNLNMSKSTFYRKIRSLTGLSPLEFIHNIRLKHACKMLKDKSLLIADVAYSLGFSDPKYFTSCFKSEFGMTPSEYQKQSLNESIY
ncbi:MAG: response regulator [Candidatus Symbiothrix sp.]|jgi:signal transduction histidine kinase/ligand-binding sensor domain-containing protein/DNA-binding response OmpR family regulator|nr:response regulator [Candidatus Symbiothrix sp.]